LGSLTKLWTCPGLRLGYVIAPDATEAERICAQQPYWSVNGLALALLPALLEQTDLAGWCRAVADSREAFAAALESLGYTVQRTAAPWLLVERAAGLRDRLAPLGVVVRDCTSYGWPGVVRVGLPRRPDAERAVAAFAAARSR
jgi:histidinol-phosphate/aromatic aminotransferase/cobyric acid decarboxylase-like protein